MKIPSYWSGIERYLVSDREGVPHFAPLCNLLRRGLHLFHDAVSAGTVDVTYVCRKLKN